MAIGYGRVSSLNQEITGYSLPAQEKIIRDYAEKHSLEIGKRIILVAESASGKVDRKKFHEMLDLVKKEGICNMIVESVDRLARNFREANKIDEWLMSDGRNRIHFIRGSTVMHKDSEYQEWFFYRMNLAAAEMGTKQISANVRKGQKEKIAQGGFPSKPPLGYRTTGERGHKTHEIDPEKAPFIKQMFELYSSGQHSLKSLTKLLEQEGLRNRSGRPIVKSRVAELLSDPFYYGDMRWGGEIYLAGHKPLISKELYDRVQKIMHSKTTPKYRKHDFLFKQLMKCEICGGTITGEIQKNHIYYHCNGYRGCKRRISARGDVLEAQIIEVFDWFENGLDPEEVGIVQEILKEDHKDKIQYMQNQISEIHSRLNTLTQREKRDYENMLDGKTTREEHDQRIKEWGLEKQALIDKESKLAQNNTHDLLLGSSFMDLARRSREIYNGLKDDVRAKREFLSLIFSNLTLNNGILKKFYRTPVLRIRERAEQAKNFEPTKNPSINGASGVLYHQPIEPMLPSASKNYEPKESLILSHDLKVEPTNHDLCSAARTRTWNHLLNREPLYH